QGGEGGRCAARASARRHAGDRTEDHRGRAEGACRGSLRRKPDELRGDRTEKRDRAGQGLGQAARKTAEIGMSAQISLHLRGFPALARARQSLYGAARIGDSIVNRNLRPTSSARAVILLGMVALALAGCGRKGPLDLPPTASSPTASVAPAA